MVLAQEIVGADECCGIAVFVPTDAAIVKLFLELVEFVWVAVDNEECTSGIRCMAAPIVDVAGEVSTAISISGPTVSFTLEKIDLWKRELVKVARKISFNLAGTPRL